MKQDVVKMEHNLQTITGGMTEMSKRFTHLNSTVNQMDYNVHEMSKSVPNMPFP